MARRVRLLRFALFLAAGSAPLAAPPAAAETDKAAAEALFDQGVRLMKQSSFAEACPKLEESERIDPAVGTLLYLGECYERLGKTASAWATFREAASLASNSNQAERARVASGRAQDLEAKLSRLSVELAPDVAQIPGVEVKRGQKRLEPSLYGTPLPVDPGDYWITVTAPGYEPWSAPIRLEANGANASVRVPGLVKRPGEPAAAPPPPPPPPAALDLSATPPPPPKPPSGLTTAETMGLVVGGVGLVGVGIGSYFGVRAIKQNSDAEGQCSGDNLCSRAGIDLTEKAKKSATISNVAFAAGGALVAVGAIVFLTGGAREREHVAFTPLLGSNGAMASLSGRF